DGETVRSDTILIRDVLVGPFPEAALLHSGFAPGIPRVRLTLDVGAGLRKQSGPLGEEATRALLAFCPRLLAHECGGNGSLRDLLAGPAEAPGPGSGAAIAARASVPDDGDGLHLAHLIEHVAIELIVTVTRVHRSSGATCAHAGRLDRFDIFLECADPLTGRAAAVLAVALVRDLRLGLSDRLALHRRCLRILGFLAPADDARLVAEDVALRLECGREEALQALQEMVRLGYLDAGPAAYVFSSPTGVLFRRAAVRFSPG
ncbi:MAG: hypothetical protein HYS34_04435, partial [Acidobacteria bacterium]|nr:hypothetical protein [Acidobacteriota bacterium]